MKKVTNKQFISLYNQGSIWSVSISGDVNGTFSVSGSGEGIDYVIVNNDGRHKQIRSVDKCIKWLKENISSIDKIYIHIGAWIPVPEK